MNLNYLQKYESFLKPIILLILVDKANVKIKTIERQSAITIFHRHLSGFICKFQHLNMVTFKDLYHKNLNLLLNFILIFEFKISYIWSKLLPIFFLLCSVIKIQLALTFDFCRFKIILRFEQLDNGDFDVVGDVFWYIVHCCFL